MSTLAARFVGGSRAHQADKPHDLRASRVILGWVTKVPLPLVTSTKPRSTKFWIAFRTVARLTLNRSTKPPSDGTWAGG